MSSVCVCQVAYVRISASERGVFYAWCVSNACNQLSDPAIFRHSTACLWRTCSAGWSACTWPGFWFHQILAVCSAHFEPAAGVTAVLGDATLAGVDSRPSDALNLALRFGAPIYVHRQVPEQNKPCLMCFTQN